MMNIFDCKAAELPVGCLGCEDRKGVQRAMVAFGPLGSTVVAATPWFIWFFQESMIDSSDIWDGSEPGLLVWEGRIVGVTYPSTPNGPEEYDTEYLGEFRPATEAEVLTVLRGENPWPIEEPPHTCGIGEGDKAITDA